MLASISEHQNIEIVWTRARGQVAQRAVGLSMADSEFIVQLDDDILLEYDCLEKLLLAAKRVGAKSAISPAFIKPESDESLYHKLARAKGPVHLILPQRGGHEWDRPGAPLHAPAAYAAFVSELAWLCPDQVTVHQPDCHINDAAFSDLVIDLIADWMVKGVLPTPAV